ncbi:MAG: hypothetical protein ACOY99_07005 [Pseudomonadota bacterium]
MRREQKIFMQVEETAMTHSIEFRHMLMTSVAIAMVAAAPNHAWAQVEAPGDQAVSETETATET